MNQVVPGKEKVPKKFGEQLREDIAKQLQVLRGATTAHWLKGFYFAGWNVFVNALAYAILWLLTAVKQEAFPAFEILNNGDLLVMSIAFLFTSIRLLFNSSDNDEAKWRAQALPWPMILIVSLLVAVVFFLAAVKGGLVKDWKFTETWTWILAVLALISSLIATVIDEAVKDPEHALARLHKESNDE